MAQKLTYICDLCQTKDIESPAPNREPVTFSDDKYYMDLCDDCHKEWYLPFAEKVAEIGQKVRPSEKTSTLPATHYEQREYKCLGCGEIFNSHNVRTGHMLDHHPEMMHRCPEENCGKLVMPSKQGMTMHYVRSHPGLDYPNNG